MHQTRPLQGRVGCELLPGASHPTHSLLIHSAQRHIGLCCPYRRRMFARHRLAVLRLQVIRLEAVIRNQHRQRRPILSICMALHDGSDA
jgi:hypothetical protein